ncbi:fumarate hydratase, partial [Patescibacteria group bacterium]|nr:fumarate hydratase [Patescibacteria group bacterium]
MFEKNILELIRETSTNLPADVVEALIQARNSESKTLPSQKRGSCGNLSLEVILKNIELAQNQKTPICQDTGSLTFFVKAEPSTWKKIEKAIRSAVRKATKEGILRPNAVDSISGKNLGNIPKIEFDFSTSSKKGNVEIALLLKGGGSENVSAQVALPVQTDFGFAKRDSEGVKLVALQILKNAGGKGCPPGIISIAIGGDRASGFALAKKNLLKKIGEENPNLKLKKLEAEIICAANKLKIGAGGLGGSATLLDCKVDCLHRHPASFFVSAAYSCWACRRGKVILDSRGKIISDNFSKNPRLRESKVLHADLKLGKIKKIKLPISAAEVRKLKAGEVVSVSGKIFTARDRVHEFAISKKLPKKLEGLGVFHCGPIAIQIEVPRPARGKFSKKIWRFLAAGPTTSVRLEPFTPKFIEKTGVRILIGKGGMGEATARALRKFGCVYLHAIGGAAAFYANSVHEVCGVDFLEEFGMPEAMW